MPTYTAMLRGINVSGQKIIRMEHLRELCAALGFRNVETYVQSGNIVFLAASTSSSVLRSALVKQFSATLGSRCPSSSRHCEKWKS